MMKQKFISAAFFTLLVVAVAVFFEILSINNRFETEVGQLRDSLSTMQLTLDSLRAQTPGLGEYMSAIQLHAAKLWFAERALNWKLAAYELDELEETVEAAQVLHAVKNTVDISTVLESMKETQVLNLRTSLERKDPSAFGKAYNEMLSACNGCHRPAGYEFIHIIVPTREPVTNQSWKPVN